MSSATLNKPGLKTSAMIASIAAEGQRTRNAPFGAALVELAARRGDIVGMSADLAREGENERRRARSGRDADGLDTAARQLVDELRHAGESDVACGRLSHGRSHPGPRGAVR